jgi:hypothetical protein
MLFVTVSSNISTPFTVAATAPSLSELESCEQPAMPATHTKDNAMAVALFNKRLFFILDFLPFSTSNYPAIQHFYTNKCF